MESAIVKNNMRSHRFAFYLLIAFCLLTSCQTSQEPILPTISVIKTTPEKYIAATQVQIPTLESGSTPTQIPEVVINPPKLGISEQCPVLSDQVITGIANGTLLLNERGSTLKLLNLSTGTESDFDGGLPIVTSPNKNQFVYYTVNPNTLEGKITIATLDNFKLHQFFFQQGWLRVAKWLNDHLLLIRVKSQDAPYPVAVLDIESGQSKEFLPDFPNISLNMTDWNGAGPTAYNASLERVIYAGWNESSSAYEYVLWDIVNNKPIASLVGSSYSGDGVNRNPPEWSSDGSKAALISIDPGLDPNKDEIYLMDKNGRIKRLTNLADQYKKVKIGSMIWSPDGKKLAFWVTLEPGPFEMEAGTFQDERLAILNTETMETTIYCISGDTIGSQNGVPSFTFMVNPISAPIWSHDGNWVVVENRYADNSSRLILLNVTDLKAFVIRKDTQVSAWINNSP